MMWTERRYLWAYCLLALVVFSIALPCVFTTLAPYDDEGYVMMTVQTFAEGHRLYGDTHTQYGPAYYWITAPLHTALGWPLSQDGVRLKTAIFWCLIVLMSTSIVHRISKSWEAACCMGVLVGVHLQKLALEPGHPQELALLLSLLALGIWIGRTRYDAWIVGSIVGLVGLIKINCGAMVAIALVIPILMPCMRHPKFGLVAKTGLAMIACSLPCLILLSAPLQPWGWMLPCTLGLAVLSLIVSGVDGGFREKWPATLVNLLVYVLGGAMSVAAIVGLTMSQGTHAVELLWGLVGQHRQFTTTFYHPVIPHFFSIAAVVIMLAMYWSRGNEAKVGFVRYVVPAAILAFILCLGLDCATALEHGLKPRGAAAWLAMVGPCWSIWITRTSRRNRRARWSLAIFACLSPLLAFPTPGTQVSLGALPSLIALGVLLGDAWHRMRFDTQNKPGLRAYVFGAMAVTCLAILGPSYRWCTGDGLQVSGSQWLRLEPEAARRERRLVEAILATEAKHLVFDGHTHNRFYFWTGLRPLTAANPTFWPRMLSHREQKTWLMSMEEKASLCVVLPPERERLSGNCSTELRRRLTENWTLQNSVDSWHVGVKTKAYGTGY